MTVHYYLCKVSKIKYFKKGAKRSVYSYLLFIILHFLTSHESKKMKEGKSYNRIKKTVKSSYFCSFLTYFVFYPMKLSINNNENNQ